jgi:UDP-N-acetylmuramoyl-tripeptide--D-alanyl-D-alanine ligase
LLEGAGEAGFERDKLHHFDDAQSAGEFLKTFIRPGDLVLIKASRGIGLDRFVNMLTNGHAEGAH